MGFTPDVVETAFQRARKSCECNRSTHNHSGTRCNKTLIWEQRGREDTHAWEAHHRVSQQVGGGDTLSNCEILCWNCHKKTL